VLDGPTGWVVVLLDNWSERVTVTRVAPDGTAGAEEQLGNGAAAFGAALDGERLVLALKHYTGTPAEWDPHFVTVEADGTETAVVAQLTAHKEEAPDVAITGNGTRLAVWVDQDAAGVQIIAGARMSPTGEVLDAPALRLTPPGTSWPTAPVAAGDGIDGFFVVWQSGKKLFAQHLSGTQVSAPLDFTTFNPGWEPLTQHVLVELPTGALVVYARLETGDVVVQELSLAGGFHASPPEVVSEPGFSVWPAVGRGPGAAWFVYSRSDFSAVTLAGTVRTYALAPLGDACTADWMCATNACEAGACAPERVTSPGGDVLQKRYLTVGCSAAPAWTGLVPLAFLLLARRRRRA